MPVVKLGVIGQANIGEEVYIIGRPSGLENTISVGSLIEIREVGRKVEIMRMTAPASPGMSGNPVVNRNGEVVGVVTSGSSALHNFSSAISVKLIEGKISSEGVTAIKESGLEDYINSATYWNSFGLAHYESGKYKDAIDAYKRAIKVDPDYTYAHLNLGVAYLKSHMQKNAIEALRRLIRIDPDNPDAHLNLSLAYLLLNDRGSAIEQYKILKTLDSEKADRLFNVIYK